MLKPRSENHRSNFHFRAIFDLYHVRIPGIKNNSPWVRRTTTMGSTASKPLLPPKCNTPILIGIFTDFFNHEEGRLTAPFIILELKETPISRLQQQAVNDSAKNATCSLGN